ncbi:hypothetical protein ADUPG1_010133 [Aduncisulcus paluster]|uniref:Thioredoxin domain-containing protein n=1 Tax=Aduncisulcus paluster TaxID=2918883 RepID=A0ABQ5KZ40_9EUKA|nr:hypothetical protein ADUPG1_010133 [Aduncisulcus paluster]
MSSSTDIQIVDPEFIHEGHGGCCPIPRDAPNIKSSEIPSIKAINETKEEDDEEYDQSVEAQKMMKGEVNNGHFTHISIPFSSSSQMKGASICLNGLIHWYHISPPSHLTFTLTSSKGEKTSKKYEFPEFEGWHWYFLPVDLPDVVLCEITGKGREEEYFDIDSLVFISREETSEEIKARKAREKLWSEAPVVKPEFVKEGDYKSEGRDSIPIPCDNPQIVDPLFPMVKCKRDSYRKESEEYDQSSQSQTMLIGKGFVWLSHISIPFPLPSPMKGAYICVNNCYSSPSLLFTFTDCDGKKTSKKYEFTEPEHDYEWHFLPIDLDNVVLCEIEGKGTWFDKNSRDFWINSLVFTIPEEIVVSELLSLLPWEHSKDDIMTKLEKTCYYFEFVEHHPKVVIDCFAQWCGPCKRISPIFHSLAEKPEYSTIDFVQIDVDEADDLAEYLEIAAMPTFISYLNGEKKESFTGASERRIELMIKSLL